MGTVAEKLTYLNGTKSSLKTAINNLGGDITSSTTFRNYATELNDIYDNLPKVSDTGTNVSLNPTLKGRLGIVPKGNTLQDGEPTPETPVEIQSATGTQKVVVSGKNLVNIESGTQTINNYYYNNFDLNYTIAENMVGKKISFSFDIDITSLDAETSAMYYNIGYGDTSMATVIQQKNYSAISTGKYSNKLENITITEAMVGKKLYTRFLGFNPQSSASFTYSNAQLEFNQIATDYQPYQEPQEVDIELGNIELNKIGNYEDYIGGTPDNWVLYKNIGKVVLDGSENWVELTGVSYKTYYVDSLINATRTNDTAPYYSDYFASITNNQRYVNNSFFINSNNRIIISYNDITTVANFKTWLSTHNTEVYYVLATETTETITEEPLVSQLNELYYLMSYDDTTNIDVTGNLPMRITASAIKGA